MPLLYSILASALGSFAAILAAFLGLGWISLSLIYFSTAIITLFLLLITFTPKGDDQDIELEIEASHEYIRTRSDKVHI